MKPRILISGCDESRILYENAVSQCGGIPESYYLPPLDDSCDALLLCGGNDVAPRNYGQDNISCQVLDEQRDQIEIQLVKLYAQQKKPILGICRGLQLLNVALGGSLIQDIGPELHLFHSQWQEPQDKIHLIRTREGSLIHSLYGSLLTVNSLHHQAVDRIAPGLTATAWSEGGIIEVAEHDNLPIVGVQWHPERMSFTRRRPDAADGSAVFQWLISAAQAQNR